MMLYTHSYQDYRGVYTHVFYNICDKKVAMISTYNPVYNGDYIKYSYLSIYHDNNVYTGVFNITLAELVIKGKYGGRVEDVANLALSIIEKKIFENI